MRNAPVVQTLPNTEDQNFPAIPTNQVYAVSVLATQGDSTAAGTVKLQASNDVPEAGQLATFSPTNWVDIADATATVTSGGAVLIPMTQICYQWIRVVWTASVDGTSNMTASINVQGF